MDLRQEFEKQTGWNYEKQTSIVCNYRGMSFYAEYEKYYIKWLEKKINQPESNVEKSCVNCSRECKGINIPCLQSNYEHWAPYPF